MNRTSVLSSNIASIGYEAGTLEVEFKSGSDYQYFDVPEHVYRSFLVAPSKGTYFAEHIKGQYQEVRLV